VASPTGGWIRALSVRSSEQKAQKLSLEPRVIRGADHRKFLKDNEPATKKLMKW
jgi:hypothetical protein